MELEILPIIAKQQDDHGLKHGYYHVYRKYCTKHLKKLRAKVKTWAREYEKKKQQEAYEADDRDPNDILEETLNEIETKEDRPSTPIQDRRNPNRKRNQQKKKNTKKSKKYERHAYQGYKITEDHAKHDDTFVKIILWEAERAWAYGMQLKREFAEEKPRAKYYAKQKFAKAVKQAFQLESLIESLGDARTKLEAKAYFSYLSGVSLIEQEDYDAAYGLFNTAYKIYEQFSRVADSQKKELYRHKAQDIQEHYIVLCKHKLHIGDEDVVLTMDLDEQIKEVMDREQEKSGSGASSFSTINWLGQSIDIHLEKTRAKLSAVSNLKKQVIPSTKNLDSRMNSYDKLMSLYNDMLTQISQDLIASSGDVSVEKMNDIRAFHSCISYLNLETVIDRNQSMIDHYVVVNRPGSKKRSGDHVLTIRSDDKQVSARDLVRLYDVMIQNFQKMEDVPSVCDDQDMVTFLRKQSALAKVYKIYYLSREYFSKSDWIKADSLLLYAKKAATTFESLPLVLPSSNSLITLPSESTIQNQYDVITEAIQADRCAIHANFVLESTNSSESKSSSNNENDSKRGVLDDFNRFHLVKKGNPHLINFPPNFQSIPCKPMFYDLVGSHLNEFPDISDRMKKASGGFFSFWS